MADPSLLFIPRIPTSDDPQPGTDAAIDYREMERWARYLRDSIYPLGTMRPTANKTAAPGWMICDGSAIQRIQYSSLFNTIGTTYGVGDGSTTFNIPDCRGRVLMGSGTASGGTVNRVLGSSGGTDAGPTITNANLPQHTHTTPSHQHSIHAKYTTNATHTHQGIGGFVAENPNPQDGDSSPSPSTNIDGSGTSGTAGSATPTPINTTPAYVVVNYEIRVL